ncbi:Uncharacterized membrane protein YckC, RDD family [Filimonas lacunae]|uniref:Uncharacterized membrane protein YckC, RDD family n=1 Tax=Filimonas lacunae TaxID=477680 RepID=A0A173MEP1_9BACT|nr:RDD family protein [Filimonas lacunae]BAV06073.1 hypothetical protein FLA_2088 [Filimonas lacunae]SIT24537.1 Uncharacterized membrane protein YckC, RDD family [Filimonas lacunae]
MQQQQDILSDFNQEQTSVYGVDKGTRFVNALIDGVVLRFIDWILLGIFSISSPTSFLDMWPSMLAGSVIAIAYYTIMEGATGQTVGKMVTRTKVIRTDLDRPVNFTDALVRSIIRTIPILDAISIFWGEIWHDQFSRTRVVKKI